MRPSVRISVVFWLFAAVAFLVYFISHLTAFIHIFFEHAGITLTQQDAADAFKNDPSNTRTQHIPKIIHQVFHNWKQPGNDTLPDDWTKVRQTCIDYNPGWEYKVRFFPTMVRREGDDRRTAACAACRWRSRLAPSHTRH